MNGIILVDKPEGWTSFDVVAKLKGVLHERRLGHSGTLDPLATGLLVIFAGRATKAVEFAQAHTKRYIAGIKLGISTDTQDITGNIIAENKHKISKAELLRAVEQFTGSIQQIPPMYSAVKVNGQKLYDIARKGETVARRPRDIIIERIDIIEGSNSDYLLDVTCSKGTYIRTLCNDIGDKLGCGACMSSLRRIKCGSFELKDAHTLSDIIEAGKNGTVSDFMLPVETVFSDIPRLRVDPVTEKKIKCGSTVSFECADGEYMVFSYSGEFLMLGKSLSGRLYSEKNFFEV